MATVAPEARAGANPMIRFLTTWVQRCVILPCARTHKWRQSAFFGQWPKKTPPYTAIKDA